MGEHAEKNTLFKVELSKIMSETRGCRNKIFLKEYCKVQEKGL